MAGRRGCTDRVCAKPINSEWYFLVHGVFVRVFLVVTRGVRRLEVCGSLRLWLQIETLRLKLNTPA